jgi:hypothetical protein
MASWALIPALTGFHYSAVEKTLEFAPVEGTFFWSDGYAWGTVIIKKAGNGYLVDLKPEYGTIILKELILTGVGVKKVKDIVLSARERTQIKID